MQTNKYDYGLKGQYKRTWCKKTYSKRLLARPRGFFFVSAFSTLGVCDFTLPARANEPWTLPEKKKTHNGEPGKPSPLMNSKREHGRHGGESRPRHHGRSSNTCTHIQTIQHVGRRRDTEPTPPKPRNLNTLASTRNETYTARGGR